MEKLRRLELHEILKDILGSNNVYFQPPESIKIQYPCIIYNRQRLYKKNANDRMYIHKTAYQVTFIDRDIDNDIKNKLLELPFCSYDRYYPADGLHHDVYTIYY